MTTSSHGEVGAYQNLMNIKRLLIKIYLATPKRNNGVWKASQWCSSVSPGDILHEGSWAPGDEISRGRCIISIKEAK